LTLVTIASYLCADESQPAFQAPQRQMSQQMLEQMEPLKLSENVQAMLEMCKQCISDAAAVIVDTCDVINAAYCDTGMINL